MDDPLVKYPGYTITLAAGPQLPLSMTRSMWDVRLHGETLFQSNLAELETRVSQHFDAMQLNAQRANLLGLLRSRVETLSAGAIQRTATGRFSSSSPTLANVPSPKTKTVQALKDAYFNQPSISDILGPRDMAKKVDKDAHRKEELIALSDDLKAQQKHYAAMGAGKPADHEYNLKANGYLRLIEEWPQIHSYLAQKKLK